MKNKRQHYIPNCYLKAWCDPESTRTPYVWMFSKDGTEVRNKAPENIFYETDFYTLQTVDGQRDLTLENNLANLEGKFTDLRRNKLDKKLPLSLKDKAILCTFVVAMYCRTKAHRVHWRKQWQKVLDLGEKVERVWDGASPEQRTQLANQASLSHLLYGKSTTLADFRKMVERPMQNSLVSTVVAMTPLLFDMPYLILEVPKNLELITSDAPCVWSDPVGRGGLLSPSIEITLPLSPRQLVVFSKGLKGRSSYLPIQDETVIENLNKHTRLSAHEHFIFNRNKPRAKWF